MKNVGNDASQQMVSATTLQDQPKTADVESAKKKKLKQMADQQLQPLKLTKGK